jgi:hypothetical protein
MVRSVAEQRVSNRRPPTLKLAAILRDGRFTASSG